MTLNDLHNRVSAFPSTDPMPILFIGHGTPMNAIEVNEFTNTWVDLSHSLPAPTAIVCISAHWETRGTFVTINEKPKTIHDFYGFPKELYQQEYPALGAPQLAEGIINEIKDPIIESSNEWGLDHGAWTILKYLYPNANIPTIQISINHNQNTRWHYELGKELSFLRSKGVLIIGSGNMVHNLRMINVQSEDFNEEHGYDWAFELNEIFKEKIIENDTDSLIAYTALHPDARLAIPTPEHYIPLLYTLGMRKKDENIKIFNDKIIAGSLSMTSVIIGNN